MKKSLIAFAFIVSSISVQLFGQENPVMIQYDDILLRQRIQEDTSVLNKYFIYENNLKALIQGVQWTKTEDDFIDTLINGKRIIPVVFHIVHKYGEENISSAQIEDAIKWLNVDYSNINTDTTEENAWLGFRSRRGNPNIEFRLVKIDPNGNYTDGIQRHYDERTSYAYYDVNHDYAWNPKKYLNIYSVSFVYPTGMTLADNAVIGGLSVFPPSNPLTTLFTNGDTLADGVIIRHDGIGTIGTAEHLAGQALNAKNRIFTHEMGHYFNLYHPFQNILLVGTFPVPGADGCAAYGSGSFSAYALNGDEVDDTPPVAAATQSTTLSCIVPGSRNTCTNLVNGVDDPDMVENYMDYQTGYCNNTFTIGQIDRLNASMAIDRKQLCSYENLLETGVLDTAFHPMGKPVADFNASLKNFCSGLDVLFSDMSFNAPVEHRYWEFEGGVPASSTEVNPTVRYDNSGSFGVKLIISNASGGDTIYKVNYINVGNPASAATGNLIEGFDAGSLPLNWSIFNQDGKNTWEITDSVFYNGGKSIRLMNFSNNSNGSIDEIITSAYNFTTISTSHIRIKFRLAYAGKKVTSKTYYDRLQVHYSLDCGQTWVQKYSKQDEALSTAGSMFTSFVPINQSQWREESILIPSASAQNPNVKLKFSFKNFGGNNIYIDSLIVVNYQIGVEEESAVENLNLNIFPNPVTDNSLLKFELDAPQKVSLEIENTLGQKVFGTDFQPFNEGEHAFLLSKDNLKANGVFFAKLRVGNTMVVRRFIIL